MFTGLIEQVGEIESVRTSEAGRELRVRAPFADLSTGESIAVNGACLTVREFGAGWFMTTNILTKVTYTNQKYLDYPANNIKNGGKFKGMMIEAVIGF